MPGQIEPLNPYRLPADRQGWRGVSLPGSGKRKWYTLLHNDQVLVTALVLLPGESSVRHCHESGELSIWYLDPMQPMVKWNPPGVFHPGPEELELEGTAAAATAPADAAASELLERLGVLEDEIRQLKAIIEDMRAGPPRPRVLVDVLLPPFTTTIDDPRFGRKTVVGQWFD